VTRGASPRRRVLILHPNLQPIGGSEAVATWMIQALKSSWDVTVLTWARPDFDALNRWYGTSIQSSEVDVHVVPRAARRVVDAAPLWLGLLRYALTVRTARRVAHRYDAVICAENEAALGRTILQYIHYPRFLTPRPQSDMHAHHRVPGLLRAYYAICGRIAPCPADEVAQNVTLANSAWTAEQMRAAYPSANIAVVHPPVATEFPNVAWDRRENGFVCIGRFAHDKEAAKVIRILGAVRRVVPDVHLHFAGGRAGLSAFRRLARLTRPHRSWIEIHENLSREELAALAATHRYGIHGKADEHFGIGPAELVHAGCVVFLPNGGGQVEIAGHDARVLYRDAGDAVAKIVHVLTEPREQMSLRTHLADVGLTFSAERFMQSIQEAVARLPSGDAGGHRR
jgi:glycosyltransferase involved in cell wall biosynthesis